MVFRDQARFASFQSCIARICFKSFLLFICIDQNKFLNENLFQLFVLFIFRFTKGKKINFFGKATGQVKLYSYFEQNTINYLLQGLTFFLVYSIFSAVLGMLQFGYNTGVINAPEQVNKYLYTVSFQTIAIQEKKAIQGLIRLIWI